MDILENVTEAVRLFNAPVSMRQIAEETKYSLVTTSRALEKLVSQGILEMVGSGNTKYYQIRTAKKSQEEIDLETRFVELSEALDEKIARHDRRIERVEKETEHLYTNMISIMSVFVAIFALIVINANAIAGTISEDAKICDALLKLAVLNIPVVLCIIALLVGVRFIILRDFKRGDHK